MSYKEFFHRLDSLQAMAENILKNNRNINFQEYMLFYNLSTAVDYIYKFFSTYDINDFDVDFAGNIIRRKNNGR